MNGFDAPKIEYFTVSPILIVLAFAVLGVLVEAFAPRGRRYLAQVVLSLVGLVAATVTTVMVFARLNPTADEPKNGKVVAMGALVADGPARFWRLVEELLNAPRRAPSRPAPSVSEQALDQLLGVARRLPAWLMPLDSPPPPPRTCTAW